MGSKDGQNSDSKKVECLTIKQDIPNNASAVSASRGPSISVTSTLETEGDRRAEFEEAPDIVSICSSDSFIIETHKVITLEDEPTDPGSELEVMSRHMQLE